MPNPTSRNRAAEARERGRIMRSFELSTDADALIDAIMAGIAAEQGTCTRVQAVEYAVRQAAKKFQKKSRPGLDAV